MIVSFAPLALGLVLAAPQEPVQQFADRLVAGEDLRGLFTTAGWEGVGAGFVAQAERKGFTLAWSAVARNRIRDRQDPSRILEDRGTVTLDISVDGALVDRAYVYVVDEDGAWRVDWMDEDEDHLALFIAGGVEARFDPTSLPPSDDLDTLAQAFVAGGLPDGVVPSPASTAAMERIEEFSIFVRSYWSEALRQGAISFRSASGEGRTVYLSRRHDGWRVTMDGHGGPNARSMLSMGCD